ncbi:TerB family tellurite resistance protein [Actinomadura oligospora]|uniref:TerB family tellurite resistance protein n=1 Tax=Actinomadura oligospora TaxID=111804 RepID=UPI0004B656E0|nr:TerB family tellurite resistance protein [Actinomadura oligospora]
MLLVFGFSVFFRTTGEGVFHCPRCGGDRAYRRRAARRWITLFFLPAVPLRRLGEVVECRVCRARFPVSALRAPTAQQLAAALPAGMRAAAGLVLRSGDPEDEDARERAIEAVTGYGELGYDDLCIDTDLELREEFLEEEVARAGSGLAVEAKEWFLARCVRIGLADGPLDEAERRTLHRVAQLLAMSRAHALGVITMTEAAAH